MSRPYTARNTAPPKRKVKLTKHLIDPGLSPEAKEAIAIPSYVALTCIRASQQAIVSGNGWERMTDKYQARWNQIWAMANLIMKEIEAEFSEEQSDELDGLAADVMKGCFKCIRPNFEGTNPYWDGPVGEPKPATSE